MKAYVLAALFSIAGGVEAAHAQSQADLELIMASWAEKPLESLAHTYFDTETGEWEAIDAWTWDVELVGSTAGRFFGKAKDREFEFFVKLADGIYTSYELNEAGKHTNVAEHTLVDAHVESSSNWTMEIAWRNASEGEPQLYAEMLIAGDVFVRTDFSEDPESGERVRILYSVSQRMDRE